METQISVETEIDLEEESKAYKTNLLKGERGKRQTHIDVLLITAVFAIFVERTLSIYSNTEKAMIKHPKNIHSGNDEDMFIIEDKYFILPIEHWILLIQKIGHRFVVPLLYFLSGPNFFYSLFKRNEREFREERVHPLFVPFLTLYFIQFFDAFTYFAICVINQFQFGKFENPGAAEMEFCASAASMLAEEFWQIAEGFVEVPVNL